MFTVEFWKRAAERAGKTAGQAFILAVGAEQMNVLTGDWPTLLGFAAGGAVLSIATSLATANIGPADDPSAVD